MNMRRFIAGLTAFALYAMTIFTPALETRALASQNQLTSPTTGIVGGLQLTNNFNNAIDSVNTANSGATAPTNQLSGSASPGNWWLNTTSAPYPLGMNDGSSHWPTLAWLDNAAHAWNSQIGGGVATLASASTVDICSTPQNYLTISGTTTINSFGSTCPAGVAKLVTFSGVTTLDYNATSMLIPGAANVLTSVGDQALMVSLGSGNWQVAHYTPASGGALINPSVDLGTYLFTSLTAPPSSKYLFAYGQAVSRTTYATYMAASTISQSITAMSGSPTLVGFSDTTQIGPNVPIEGSAIPGGASIVSCTSTTCTMNANATASTTMTVAIFPYGNGNGSTTFNLPDCRGRTFAGRDNMGGTPAGILTSTYANQNPDALGVPIGSQSRTIAQNQLPNVTLGVTGSASVTSITINSGTGDIVHSLGATMTGVQGGGTYSGIVGTGIAVGGNLGGSGSGTISGSTASINGGASQQNIATVSPALTANCMIRVLAMIDAPSFPASIAGNDNNDVLIADRRRVTG